MDRCHNCGEHTEADSGPCCTLYDKIDIARVQCLNECTEGTGATVFKKWEDRLDRTKFVESDIDAELLFNIPFTGNVKLKSIIVIADEELEPNVVRLSGISVTQGPTWFRRISCENSQILICKSFKSPLHWYGGTD
ncbi:PITH domain-containing protein 1 isoform X2 [Harpegnathos saltator]|uniref:PITH domain-containing protein 1 isoform X2 n=1 Tax=Harpegnathos saltator TaxID=610380 RepID=UPI000948D503|nr:PITH domain-containing protein 1 isoform X2 [Harpegnathos saltator]